MIFGRTKQTISDSKFAELTQLIHWERSQLHKVSFMDFEGGIYLDPRLPYSLSDSFSCREDEGIAVLLFGRILNMTAIRLAYPDTASIVSDPSVIVYLYQKLGESFINHVEGEFVIYIYDYTHHCSFLYRDHVGIRTCAYISRTSGFYFSTDVFALSQCFYTGKNLNLKYVAHFHVESDGLQTPIEEVKMLRPGCYLRIMDNQPVQELRYWKPENTPINHKLTHEQMISDLRGILENVFRVRYHSQHKASAHLSGGLDSGLVSVYSRKLYAAQSEFYAYSWSASDYAVPDASLDERTLIKEICEFADMIPVFRKLSETNIKSLMSQQIYNFGYFYEHQICQHAQSHQVTQLFSGWGGDEFLTFGSLGVDMDLFLNFEWRQFFQRNPLNKPRSLARVLLWNIFFPFFRIPPIRSMFQNKEYNYFLNKNIKKLIGSHTSSIYGYQSRRELQLSFLTNNHLSARTGDWTTMGYKLGVEYSFPLLDKKIIEYMLSVPSRLLCKQNGYTRMIPRLLTEGLLPEAARWRTGKRDYSLACYALDRDHIMQAIKDLDINSLRENPELDFINIDLLEKEIENHLQNRSSDISLMTLSQNVEAFSMYNGFTRAFKEGCSPYFDYGTTKS